MEETIEQERLRRQAEEQSLLQSTLASRNINEERRSSINKIIQVPADVTKFVCQNTDIHGMKMVINMSDSLQRNKSHKMQEFHCSCGAIYVKK